MKPDEGIFKKILSMIKKDANAKVAILNGSRANPNAPKDFMQDYDIAVYVEDLNEAQKYKHNKDWINNFGNLVILQQNNFENGSFIFLIQYDDGNRVDLSFHHIKNIQGNIAKDSLSIVLYNKENMALYVGQPNESTYYVKKPTSLKWDETLNELWWMQVYVAKELWRDEVPLAKELYEKCIIKSLKELLSWHIAESKNWNINVGYGGKWFKHLLDEDLYNKFIWSYSDGNIENQWEKLLVIGDFIRQIGEPLSKKLGYIYPSEYDKNVTIYIKNIYILMK